MKPIDERYTEVERITLKTETGVEIAVLLKINHFRVYRMEYWIDGKLIKPARYDGANLAKNAWNHLKERLLGHSPKLDVEVKEA